MKYSLAGVEKEKFEALLSAFDKNASESESLNRRMEERDPSLFREATLLKEGDYLADPYAKAVHPSKKKTGNWELGYGSYDAKEVFLAGGIGSLGKPYFIETNPIGYFANPFHYLSLEQDGATWMSVIPHEINTMKEPLSLMKGNVVVMGLGLGYFAFHCLLKQEVKSLVVVESDHRLISLFKEELLPFFLHKEKLAIIEGDAMDEKTIKPYLSKADAVFYDIWRNEEDGLPLYAKARSFEKAYPHARFSYWMEEGILAYYRRMVIVILDSLYNYPDEKENDNQIMAQTKKALKNKTIGNYGDIEEICSDNGLKDLLSAL